MSTGILDVQAIASAQTITTTTELEAGVVSAGGRTTPQGEGLCVSGILNVTAGTGTTAVVVRVREGRGIAGTLVGTAKTHTLAAGASASIPFCEYDSAVGENQIYSVTIQQTGATGNGTVNGGAAQLLTTANE